MRRIDKAIARMKKVELTCANFSPRMRVLIISRDRTQLLFANAFLRTWADYVFVYTEHQGYHCFEKITLEEWCQLEELPSREISKKKEDP